ncbi:staphylopine family metallophore export MFS transporter CntE [Paenibacillus mucilaginosus]|uniref:Major facilitator superfamily MFS_1 n=1 Tax=Paenibacillus mucilaginosus (strain KNP414) TaxID=1036673 RepID=F8FLR2_PAEMK|nr:MFS transporter [Paenibacillus mucilaginosus]AEI44828.1 major facilitator superfamily MFS_1 [Paenibacillus mucilaginosus KNP414]MCG7214874.1 MFS transporter [Paenibacillus mucilaginosus]WDM26354.1 MFS transporter [Paenibacillus mucilaginosus]
MVVQGPFSSGQIKLYLLAVLFFSANAVLTVILPLQSDAQGMGQGEIGLMMGSYMLTCMLFRPWAGQWLSRYGALAIMRILLLVHSVCLVLFAVTGTDSYLWLRALQGAVTAFFSMIMQLAMVTMLSAKDRAQGMSLYTLSTMIPQLFGPMAALFLWETGEPSLYLGVMIALSVTTWLTGFLAPLPAAPLGEGSYTFRDMLGSTAQLWRNRTLLVCSVVMLLASCMFGAVSTFLPLYMEKTGTGHAGYYLMLQGLVVVVCRFVLRKHIPSDGSWHTGLIAGLLLSAAAGSLLLSMMESLGALVYVSAVCNGLAVAFLYPTLVTYLSFVLPSRSRAVLLGLFISSYDLGFSSGGLFMGMLAQTISYSGMFTFCAWLGLSAFILVLMNKKQMSTSKAES